MNRSRFLMLALFILAVVLLAPTIEAVGISGLWYMQDRLDVGQYTYNNAYDELRDPSNVAWINERIGS